MSIDWKAAVRTFPELPPLAQKETPVYIVSNEKDQAACLEILQKLPCPSNCIHIGVSGLHNYSMIWKTKAPMALILDFNSLVLSVHAVAKAIILESQNPQQFIKLFLQQPLIQKIVRGSNQKVFEAYKSVKNNVSQELQLAGSWLNSHEGFLYIKNLYEKNRIVLATVDLTHSQTIEKINQWMHKNGIGCATLYISNITDVGWIDGPPASKKTTFSFTDVVECTGVPKLNTSIRPLISEKTVVIEASIFSDWHQKMHEGLLYRENYLCPIRLSAQGTLIRQRRPPLFMLGLRIARAFENHPTVVVAMACMAVFIYMFSLKIGPFKRTPHF